MSKVSQGTLLRPLPSPTALARLLPGHADVPEGLQISGITLDSRIVAPGDLYVALGGERAHGADFAADAVALGAVAVLTDPAGAERARVPGEVPVLVIDDPRARMGALAAAIYGQPARGLPCFAVTGTNGKTTTTHLLAAALRELGQRVGSIGTIGFRLDDEPLVGPRTTVTTPESVDLHGLLALMRERGARAFAMEASSHALSLGRTDGLLFDVAGFTNLGRDHLDFHHTMEAYFEAKASLFTLDHCRAAVVVVDDEWGVRLASRLAAAGGPRLRTVSWPTEELTDRPEADYLVTSAADGIIEVRTPNGPWRFETALPGDFNVRNAVLALAMLDVCGADAVTAARAFASASVPGRMQPVHLGAGAPEAYVDFAHTPQAIAAALTAFAPVRRAGRRVVAVLGCGGDRDPSKRRPMGAAAAAGADVVVITDDNPRSEDPAAIRAEALAGAMEASTAGAMEARTDGALAARPTEVCDGGDRRSAIGLALRLAGPDGVVAVLGKGHEQGQEIAGVIAPFDDATVLAEQWLAITGESGDPEGEQ